MKLASLNIMSGKLVMSDSMVMPELVGEAFTGNAARSHAAKGSYYTDPKVHELELKHVFGYEWNYFCHQSQIPERGDFKAGEVAGHQIFVIRGRDDIIRAFYNVCQHRGHELVSQSEGNAGSVIVCPYHAWSYDHSGCLRGAPKMREVQDFDRSKVMLSTISLEIIGGFVFLNFDPEAKPLREMAPKFESILTAMVPDVDQLQCVRVRNYDIHANWKVVTENFLEAYHVEFSGEAHQALGRVIDIDTYAYDIDGRTIEYTADGGAEDQLPYDSNTFNAFSNARGHNLHQVFLFPHMTFSVFPGTNMMFVFNMRPNGPEKTAEEIIYFTLDGSMTPPTETAEAYVSSSLNPEDIALCEAVHRGLKSPGYKPGRLMVDPNMEASWGEQFVHHFNMLNLAALARSR